MISFDKMTIVQSRSIRKQSPEMHRQKWSRHEQRPSIWKWWIRLASRTIIGWRRILAISFIALSTIFNIKESVVKCYQSINLRQSPQILRFFVIWIVDGIDFWMKLNAMANRSLCVERTDSIVSSEANGRVIHRGSNLCPYSITSFFSRWASRWISSLRGWNQSFALKLYNKRHVFIDFFRSIIFLTVIWLSIHVHDWPIWGLTWDLWICFLMSKDRFEFPVDEYVFPRRINAEIESSCKSGNRLFILTRSFSDREVLNWVRAPDIIATETIPVKIVSSHTHENIILQYIWGQGRWRRSKSLINLSASSNMCNRLKQST